MWGGGGGGGKKARAPYTHSIYIYVRTCLSQSEIGARECVLVRTRVCAPQATCIKKFVSTSFPRVCVIVPADLHS